VPREVKLKLTFKRLHPNATLPTRATAGSVGYDLAVSEDCVVPWNGHALLPTGIALHGIAVTEPASWGKVFELQLRPRSSLFPKWGLLIPNSPGTIDSDYRGEIKISVLHNHPEEGEIPPTTVWHRGDRGDKIGIAIPAGTKIAQLVVAVPPLPEIQWAAEHESGDPSERGDGGFGSTGL
jgi:dUTP pyrophosphatase